MDTLLKLTQQWPAVFLPLWVAIGAGFVWAVWRIPKIIARRGLKIGKAVEIPSEPKEEPVSKEDAPSYEQLAAENARMKEELKHVRRPQLITMDPDAAGAFVNPVGAYVRLKPDIDFFGTWNGKDHFEQIQMISMLWNPKEHTSVGFMNSNILSEFISLVIQKLQEIEHLEIFCTPKQQNMLATYLREYVENKRVSIVVRGADVEPD